MLRAVVVLMLPWSLGCRIGFEVSDDASSNGTFTLGGTVIGLNGTLVLRNTGDERTVTADGAFVFASRLPDRSVYNVTIAAAPISQTCTIANSSGDIASANASNVTVTCATRSSTNFQCSTAESCAAGAEMCCHDRANGNGLCQSPATACMTQALFCDDAADCGGGTAVCCARFSMMTGNLADARCETTSGGCSGPASQTFEILCNPAAPSPCPAGTGCTGMSRYSVLGWRTCV
jgi:hypothetical protein